MKKKNLFKEIERRMIRDGMPKELRDFWLRGGPLPRKHPLKAIIK